MRETIMRLEIYERGFTGYAPPHKFYGTVNIRLGVSLPKITPHMVSIVVCFQLPYDANGGKRRGAYRR